MCGGGGKGGKLVCVCVVCVCVVVVAVSVVCPCDHACEHDQFRIGERTGHAVLALAGPVRRLHRAEVATVGGVGRVLAGAARVARLAGARVTAFGGAAAGAGPLLPVWERAWGAIAGRAGPFLRGCAACEILACRAGGLVGARALLGRAEVFQILIRPAGGLVFALVAVVRSTAAADAVLVGATVAVGAGRACALRGVARLF